MWPSEHKPDLDEVTWGIADPNEIIEFDESVPAEDLGQAVAELVERVDRNAEKIRNLEKLHEGMLRSLQLLAERVGKKGGRR